MQRVPFTEAYPLTREDLVEGISFTHYNADILHFQASNPDLAFSREPSSALYDMSLEEVFLNTALQNILNIAEGRVI